MEEKKSKKPIIIGVAVTLLVTLTLLGVTYAYYRTRIIGNQNDTSISVTSEKLEIEYGDGNGTIAPTTKIAPGYSVSKKFTVKNTGDGTVNYSIQFENMVNTYQRVEDWTYELRKNSESGTIVASGQVAAGSHQIIKSSTSIAKGVTDTYYLTLTYANSTEDQSEDMGATLTLKVNIGEEVNTWDNAENGTLLAAIKNNNTVTDPVTAPGKTFSGQTYTEGSLSSTTSSYTVSGTYQNYYITYGTGYEFDEDSGLYKITGLKIGKYSEVYNQLANKYVRYTPGSNINSSSVIEYYYNMSFNYISQIVSATATSISYKAKAQASVTSENEAVLASTEDDYGTSYYFRGAVENNYVNFSGMCWRIVRVQGDGHVKLVLYDRTTTCKESSSSGYTSLSDSSVESFVFNENDTVEDSLIYANSNIPAVLDAWLYGGEYTYYDYYDGSELSGSFTKKIDESKLVETEWCNDTSKILNGAGDYEYGAYARLGDLFSAKPSLRCNFIGDEDSKALKFESKIGILTADESAFAGKVIFPNSSRINANYLDSSEQDSWLLSPEGTYLSGVPNWMLLDSNNGMIGDNTPSSTQSIRPSIVLSRDVTISSGNGTKSNPYVIS